MGEKKNEKMEALDLEELNLEDILQEVNYCISQLENPQISLEDSFRYYEEGIRKLKMCNDKVEKIEKKMMVMNSQGGLDDFYVQNEGIQEEGKRTS